MTFLSYISKQQQISIPLGMKIFGIAVSLLGLMVLVAYNGQRELQELRAEVFDIAEYIIPITNRVDEVAAQTLAQEVHLERILKFYEEIPLNGAHIAREQQQFEERSQQVDREVALAVSLIREAVSQARSQIDREKLQQIEPQLVRIEQEHQDFHDRALTLLQRLAAGERGLSSLEQQIANEEDDLNRAMESTLIELGSHTVRVVEISEQNQRRLLRSEIIITLGALLLGALYSSLLTLNIVRPLRHLINQVRSFQQGRGVEALAVRSNDEVGHLQRSFHYMLSELAHKEQLKKLFGKYVDPRVVAQHEQRGSSLETSGEKQIVTVLMADIEGFQPIAHTLAPEKLVDVINLYLDLLSPTVSAQSGFIEFVDTVIKGFWAPPFVDQAAHAEHACAAALAQVAQLPELRQRLQEAIGAEIDLPRIDLHIGVATGPLILANMGPEWATMYTVLGDTVNTAARLKGVAKQFGIPILLLEETQQRVEETMVTREIGLVQVVGKDDKLRVFELLGRRDQVDPELLEWQETFQEGLAAYRQQAWDSATAQFTTCLQFRPQDRPTQNYLDLIEELRCQSLPADWDGVWQLTKK